MNEFRSKMQNEILMQFRGVLYTVAFGCGGVIFRQHFIKLLGYGESKGGEIIRYMEDFKLIKHRKLGRNYLLILQHATLSYLGIGNKNVIVSAKRVVHSATLCEMLLHLYNPEDERKIHKLLTMSNFPYFIPRNSYNILYRIYNFLSNKGVSELDTLAWNMQELDKKIKCIEQSKIGEKEQMPEKIVKADDLLILRNNDMFVKSVSYVDDTLIFHMALFANNKDSDKISEIIHRTEVALADMMGGLNIKYVFDIYSLSPKNAAAENKVLRNLLSINGNEQKEEFYKNNITYHWYNRKNTLFSGIDLDKWL